MKPTLAGGLAIGILCGLWTFVVGFAGWYRDPVMQSMFWVVILIQLAVLIWGLRKTALEGRSYSAQVWAGTLMSIIGGVILIFTSLLFTTVVFPNYFSELRELQIQMLQAQGKSDAEIAADIDALASTQTPIMQALFGFLGTVLTGLILSVILAAFFRKKEQPAPAV